MLLDDDGNEVPQAFLNYLLYDTAFQLIDQGFVRVSEAAKVTVGQTQKKGLFKKGLFARSSAVPEDASTTSNPETLELDVEINQPGYLYAYVSNESNWDAPVFFDGMQASLTEQLTVEDRQDYYPFGATHQELPGNPTNRYLYQGKEITNNLGLGLYDFHARQYDPFLGRFTSIDPAAASWAGVSPYAGMLNNPVNMVDPDGRSAFIIIGALTVLGAGTGGAIAANKGYGMRDAAFWRHVGLGAAAGAAAGVGAWYFAPQGTGLLGGHGGSLSQLFGGSGQAISQVGRGGIELAQRAFEGVGPTVGADAALQMLSNNGPPRSTIRDLPPPNNQFLLNPSNGVIRQQDGFGAGHFGASRAGGTRLHRGIDITTTVGQDIVSPVDGTATNFNGATSGIPMVDIIPSDPTLNIDRVRMLYTNAPRGVIPWAQYNVTAGQRVGTSANLVNLGYPRGITPHVHLEIFRNGVRIDPTPFFFPTP